MIQHCGLSKGESSPSRSNFRMGDRSWKINCQKCQSGLGLCHTCSARTVPIRVTGGALLPDLHGRQTGRRLAIVLDLQLIVFGELDLARSIQEARTFALIVEI